MLGVRAPDADRAVEGGQADGALKRLGLLQVPGGPDEDKPLPNDADGVNLGRAGKNWRIKWREKRSQGSTIKSK